MEDTLVAGAGLCRRSVVEHVARSARAAVEDLIAYGCAFDRRDEGYDLHREGGHSARRILHSKDNTGAEIIRALLEAVEEHPRITVLENRMVVDLITEGSLARRTGDSSVSGPRPRALRAEHRDGPRRDLQREGGWASYWRCRQGLPLHLKPRHRPEATVLRSHGAQALGCRTWSSSSFILRASTILMHGTS